MFNDSTILITGGTGSWGNVLTIKLLEKYKPKKIIIFSRGELQQVLMQRRFNNPIVQFIVGDVRDYEALKQATVGVDYIFHLAALKHVPICEDHPQEAIKTNINGTTNIVNAAILNKVKKVIDVSTDKAVDPVNLYGMTKAVGEKVILQANNISKETKFVCIRGGNVMGSNGSVIPFFIEQINNSQPITITHRDMTRFFLTLEEAIELLFKAAENSLGGEIFVMNMPSCKIVDLAEVLINNYGKDTLIKDIGIRPGEKINEVLISKNEAYCSYLYDENYFVISNNPKYHKLNKVEFREFSSDIYSLNKSEIHDMLKKGKFI